MAFVPKSTSFKGLISLPLPAAQAFLFFSPLGERFWVPGWAPELLAPPGVDWAEGQVFRTREECGDAIWIVSNLDKKKGRVVYHRVEPTRYVARIEVMAKPEATGNSEISVEYSFVGLSESGNKKIETMSQSAYDTKMQRWSKWLEQHLGQKKR